MSETETSSATGERGRLVLHMGQHKTGSSALQLWLRENDALLRAAGIDFPAKFAGRNGNGSKLATILCNAKADRSDAEAAIVKDFHRYLAKSGPTTKIFSAERFGAMILRPGFEMDGSLKNFREEKTFLRSVRALGKKGDGHDITAVILLRNVLDYRTSSMNQRRKKILPLKRNAKAEHAAKMDGISYAEKLDFLRSEGLDIRVGAYPFSRDKSLSQYIFEVADIPFPDAVELSVSMANESTGTHGLIIAGFLRHVLAFSPESSNALRRYLADETLKASAAEGDEPFRFYSAEQQAEVEARLAPDLAKLEPYLGADGVETLSKSKYAVGYASPTCWHDLDDAGRATSKAILARVLAKLDAKEDGTPPVSDALRRSFEDIENSPIGACEGTEEEFAHTKSHPVPA
ncbi:MAG: hypothetical protein AAF214_02625 [Pseudomonadota bacterium]